MSSMLVFWESLCLLCMCMYTCVYLCMVQGTEPRSSYMLSKYFITKLQCSLFVPVLNGGLNRLHMFLTPVVLLLLYLHKKNLRYSKQDLWCWAKRSWSQSCSSENIRISNDPDSRRENVLDWLRSTIVITADTMYF